MNFDNSFDEFGSCSDASKRCRPGRKATPLRVDAISPAEWNYLRGLFLADGCSFTTKVRTGVGYRVQFYLGRSETGVIRKVVELLRRAGLNPYVTHPSDSPRMVIVVVDSKSLYEFLPDKRALLEGGAERFLVENGVRTVELGVPFAAGLLDGDGHCLVRITRKKNRAFDEVRPWRWHFTQKKLPFLADYLLGFVESLVRGGARMEDHGEGSRRVVFRKRGIQALLAAGVAEHSVRATLWLRRLARVRAKREGYLTSGQVARKLGVARHVVLRWLRAGKIRYVRRGEWRYIRSGEVERLKRKGVGATTRKRRTDGRESGKPHSPLHTSSIDILSL